MVERWNSINKKLDENANKVDFDRLSECWFDRKQPWPGEAVAADIKETTALRWILRVLDDSELLMEKHYV